MGEAVLEAAGLKMDDAQSRLVESLERSKAQAEAGVSVPLEPALERLQASIARMKAKRAAHD